MSPLVIHRLARTTPSRPGILISCHKALSRYDNMTTFSPPKSVIKCPSSPSGAPMPNFNSDLGRAARKLLDSQSVIWLPTVDSGLTPQPRPAWFVPDGGNV